MIRRIIENNIAGKKVLIFFILSTTIYLIMLLFTIPRVMSYSGGMKILDMMPTGYDAAYVNELFAKLGEPGRHAYLFGQIPFDMVYPALYGIGFCLVLAWFLKKLGRLHGFLIYFCLLPIIAGFFDYCENFGIIAMMQAFPEIPVNLVAVTNIFSVLKSSLTSIFFIVLVVVLIMFAIRLLSQKQIKVNRNIN
ncbi:MAG TPA: hypothetical protein VLQ91_14710 [Draconibacterium sp.]|nr:hypothetical protein [Draconibacterium sp.]